MSDPDRNRALLHVSHLEAVWGNSAKMAERFFHERTEATQCA